MHIDSCFVTIPKLQQAATSQKLAHVTLPGHAAAANAHCGTHGTCPSCTLASRWQFHGRSVAPAHCISCALTIPSAIASCTQRPASVKQGQHLSPGPGPAQPALWPSQGDELLAVVWITKTLSPARLGQEALKALCQLRQSRPSTLRGSFGFECASQTRIPDAAGQTEAVRSLQLAATSRHPLGILREASRSACPTLIEPLPEERIIRHATKLERRAGW